MEDKNQPVAQRGQIWVIEDDPSIGPSLQRTLTAEGYSVSLAASGAKARSLDGEPDLVLLDLGLPDIDGVDLCRELRRDHPGVRVLMLTARTTEMDVVLGLDAGAVDYLTKPFRLAELLARVRVQLRERAEPASDPPKDSITVGDLEIDPAARRAWVGGTEVELRTKEFDLLLRLAREPGTVVRREDLMSDVWDENWFGSTKTLDTHMASLRRHLGEEDAETSRIATVRGVGYRLEAT